MPVDFVTETQVASYGQYPETLSDQDLAQYFYLDATARQQIATCRGTTNRLGYALQLTSLRYLGNFPDDIRTLPATVITYMAQQLTIVDPLAVLDTYQRGETRWDHRKAIRDTLAYHEFIEGVVVFPLVRLLYLRAWVSAERPSVLFETAKERADGAARDPSGSLHPRTADCPHSRAGRGAAMAADQSDDCP